MYMMMVAISNLDEAMRKPAFDYLLERLDPEYVDERGPNGTLRRNFAGSALANTKKKLGSWHRKWSTNNLSVPLPDSTDKTWKEWFDHVAVLSDLETIERLAKMFK